MTIGSSFIDTTRIGELAGTGMWNLRWGADSPINVMSIENPGDNNIGDTVLNFPNGEAGGGEGPLASFAVYELPQFNHADTDILALWRVTGGTSAMSFRLICRASGAVTAEEGYMFRVDSGSNIYIAEMSAGVRTDLVSDSSHPTIALDTWWWFQFRVIGDSLKARTWAYGDDPPLLWNLETTDSTHTAAGWGGIGHNTNVTSSFEIDYFNMAMDGAYARLPTSDPAVPAPNVISSPSSVATDADGFLTFRGPANVAVSWAVSAGDGSIGVIDTKTNASGVARAVYNPGTVGTKTIEVTYGT